MRNNNAKRMIGIVFVLLIAQSASAYETIGRRERYTIYSNGSGSYWMEQDGQRVARFHAGSRDADPRRFSFQDLLDGNIDIPAIIMNWFVDMVYKDIKKSINDDSRGDLPVTNSPKTPQKRGKHHSGAIPPPTRAR
jgi:hypothetical protein